MNAEKTGMEDPVEEPPEDLPLEELLIRLGEQHDNIVREKLPDLRAMLEQAEQVDEPDHMPALAQIARELTDLRAEIDNHLAAEEDALFPYARQLLEAREGRAEVPSGDEHAGERLEREHETALAVLDKVSRLAAEYRPPADVSRPLREFFRGLEELEEQLSRHVQVEEEVLLPRLADLQRRLEAP